MDTSFIAAYLAAAPPSKTGEAAAYKKGEPKKNSGEQRREGGGTTTCHLPETRQQNVGETETHPNRPPSGLNLHTGIVFPCFKSNALSRCLESLSQKWKLPSDPAVAKVPYLWNAIEFTEYTAAGVPWKHQVAK